MLSPPLRTPAAAESTDVFDAGGDAASAELPGDSQPVLDPRALERLADLDPTGQNQLLIRVLAAFRTSVARLRLQAQAARASGDSAALRLVAHTLKSSSASVGALRLSRLCARIETAIRLEAEHEAEHQADLDALGSALDEVLHAIEPLLKGPA